MPSRTTSYVRALVSQPHGFFLVPLHCFKIAQGAARHAAVVKRHGEIRLETNRFVAVGECAFEIALTPPRDAAIAERKGIIGIEAVLAPPDDQF